MSHVIKKIPKASVVCSYVLNSIIRNAASKDILQHATFKDL